MIGGDSQGAVNDDLFAERGGDEVIGFAERREDVRVDMVSQRRKEPGLADQGNSASDHHDFRREQSNHLPDRPSQGSQSAVEHLAGDLISVRGGLGHHFGGELVELVVAPLPQVADKFLIGASGIDRVALEQRDRFRLDLPQDPGRSQSRHNLQTTTSGQFGGSGVTAHAVDPRVDVVQDPMKEAKMNALDHPHIVQRYVQALLLHLP